MAVPVANVVSRTNLKSVYEDVDGDLHDMTPMTFNLLSEIGDGPAESIYFEWDEFTRQGAVAANTTPRPDGWIFTADALDVPSRRGNFTQINTANVAVTYRANQAKKPGLVPEITRQVQSKMLDLKEAIEVQALGRAAAAYPADKGMNYGNPAAAAGVSVPATAVTTDGDTSGGSTASIASFIKTNVSFGDGGSATALPASGVPLTANTAGNNRDLKWALIRDAERNIFNNSRDEGMLSCFVGLQMKQKISDFLIRQYGSSGPGTGEIQFNQSATGTITAPATVDMVKGDFYMLKFIPNRYIPTYAAKDSGQVSHMHILNPRTWKICYHMPMQTSEMGRKGLMVEQLVYVDWGIKSMYEKANATIADLNPGGTVVV